MKLTKKQRKKLFIAILMLIIFGVGAISEHRDQNTRLPLNATVINSGVNQPNYYEVKQFEDGDTITINMNNNIETIRFIGVDTPETKDPRKPVQCFGKAASDFTKNLIDTNKVRLEADPENTNRDRYNRLLRYVYLPNGTLVNAEIIKQGYGFAYTSFPFAKKDEFKKYEEEARQNNMGLWGSCQVGTNQKGYRTINPATDP